MDVEAKRFGRGPRELGGAADLINRYKLWPLYESFCKRSIPVSISETRYLNNVVGDTEIRKGEGMELDQLFRNASSFRETSTRIRRFDLDILGDAFRIKEISTVKLPSVENGIPTGVAKPKSELKPKKKKKRKKLESKDKQLEKEDTTHKHRDDNKISKEEDKDRYSRGGGGSGSELLKGQLDKKKRVDWFEGLPAGENQRSLVRERSRQRDCWDNLR